MIQLRIVELLAEKGISKSQFAEMMGVAKQNVNLLLETSNIKKLEQIAQVLNLRLTDLWVDTDAPKEEIYGFIEYRGQIHKIKSKEDLQALLNIMQ